MYTGLHVKYVLFLSDLNKISIFSTILLDTEISNFMKIRPLGAELFHAERQARRTEKPLLLISRSGLKTG